MGDGGKIPEACTVPAGELQTNTPPRTRSIEALLRGNNDVGDAGCEFLGVLVSVRVEHVDDEHRETSSNR